MSVQRQSQILEGDKKTLTFLTADDGDSPKLRISSEKTVMISIISNTGTISFYGTDSLGNATLVAGVNMSTFATASSSNSTGKFLFDVDLLHEFYINASATCTVIGKSSTR